jgi:DNA-binding transcriptional LysR family regulator
MVVDRNQLLALDQIVREGSFSRAARSLGLSQAAISARIAALEAEVGEPLLVRGGRRIGLTDAGEVFLPHARRALAILTEGIAAARETRTGQSGRVIVHAPGSIVDGFLAHAVVRYRATHPQVALVIHVRHTYEIVRAVTDGVALLGIITQTHAVNTTDLETLVRFREPLVATVAPGHPLAGQRAPTLAAFVAQAGPFYPVLWGTSDDARLARLASSDAPETSLPHEMVRLLVTRGRGGALFPRSFVRDDLAEGRLIAVPLTDEPAPLRELAIVHQANSSALTRAALDFVAAIREEAREFLVR